MLFCAKIFKGKVFNDGNLLGIFKSRDKPQNATSGSAYQFFIGGSSSGKNVNERFAMQMTAVYSLMSNRMTVDRDDKGQFFRL